MEVMADTPYALLEGGDFGNGKGRSTLFVSILNLVKCIVGCGTLALPAGVAAFSDEPSVGLTFGLTVMLALGTLSGYCFWLIGRMCLITCQDSYAAAFAHTFGKRGQGLVSASLIIFTLMVTLMYMVVIGDMARDLAAAVGLGGAAQRSMLLWNIGMFVMLPIALLRSLAALAPFSVLGIIGMVYTGSFCWFRFVQHDYDVDGLYYDQAPAKPSFHEEGTRHTSAFVLVSMLATAFMAHFSAPRFVRELEQPTVARLGFITAFGFAGAFAIMASVMCFGFLTFGGTCLGSILNSYAVTDPLAIVARVGTLFSLVFAFPFLVDACREDLLQLLPHQESMQRRRDGITVLLVLGSTAVGSSCNDLGFMVALVGAVLGALIVYVFPACMLFGHLRPIIRSGRGCMVHKVEFVLCWAIGALGIVFAILGAAVTLMEVV